MNYPYATDEQYKKLIAAIIEQAVTDYCDARNYLRTHKKPGVQVKGDRTYGDRVRLRKRAKATLVDVKEFMYSQWFDGLTENIDGPTLFQKLEDLEDEKDETC